MRLGVQDPQQQSMKPAVMELAGSQAGTAVKSRTIVAWATRPKSHGQCRMPAARANSSDRGSARRHKTPQPNPRHTASSGERGTQACPTGRGSPPTPAPTVHVQDASFALSAPPPRAMRGACPARVEGWRGARCSCAGPAAVELAAGEATTKKTLPIAELRFRAKICVARAGN